MSIEDENTALEGTLRREPHGGPPLPIPADHMPHHRYQIEEEITRGGMAIIYKVLDTQMYRWLAMKVLRDGFADEATERQRFLNEARITALLDHPHIVPVHELGFNHAGRPFFTMKLVHGETLDAWIQKSFDATQSFYSIESVLHVFLKVCDATAFAHDRGVIHRDIKPSNILVGHFGEVYLMDWGLARVVQADRLGAPNAELAQALNRMQDPAGMALGTFHYMSPEQARGQNHLTDERTDIFALGALLYHILTGKPPYVADSLEALLRKAREARIRAPHEVARWACLPQTISEIAMKAMAREPTDRFQTVSDLQAAVRDFLRGGFHLLTKSYPRGSVILTEGAPGDAAYIIARGTCQAYRTIDGQKTLLRRMGPGDVFGEMAVVSSKPRSASVEALDDLEVMVVKAETLTTGLGLNSWLGSFVKTLVDRFREADRRLTELQGNLPASAEQVSSNR